MPRFVLALFGAAMAASTASAQTPTEMARRDGIAFMSSEEPAMKLAFAKARATLDEFLRSASAPARGTANYALKVAVSDGKSTEYFWVADFERSGDQFTGRMTNEPRLVRKYRNGQRFAFRREAIVDWTYSDVSKRRMFGNFTACALLTKESSKEAEKFKSEHGLRCE